MQKDKDFLHKSHVQALELIYFMNPCHVRMLQSLGGANIYERVQRKGKKQRQS